MTSPILLGLIKWSVVFLVIRTVFLIVYNVYFHPLRRYPGPKLAAATGLYHWYHTIGGQMHRHLHALHGQHGDIVRIGPDRLSFTRPDAWKDIYGPTTPRRKANGKDPRFYAETPNGRRAMISTLDEGRHAAVRRVFLPAFSERALREQEPAIHKHVSRMVHVNVRQLAHAGLEIDLVLLFNYAIFDIMGDLMFSESFGMLENSAYVRWVETLLQALRYESVAQMFLEYDVLKKLLFALMPPSARKKRAEHVEYAARRVDARLEKGDTGKRDIWNFLTTGESDAVLDPEDKHANASLFMIAGTETTATTLSGLMCLLLQHPGKMRKAVAEIRNTFASEDDISMDSLQKLSYFNACVEETMRLYPPLPLGNPRVTPAGGNVICNYAIPENTRVYVSTWAACHSVNNFRDPEAFVPERWLLNSGYDDDRKEVVKPFSYGPRNCIGKTLAYHNVRIIVVRMLWNYDLVPAASLDDWMDQGCYPLWEKKPLMVKATLW